MASAGSDRGASPWLFVPAELAGYVVGIGAARLLLLPLIDAWPPAGIILKLGVAAWLVFAGWRLWRAGGAGGRHRVVAGQVFAVTTLNPKCLLLTLAIVPWSHPALAVYLATMAAVIVASGATWFAGGRIIARVMHDRARLVPRAGAAVLFAFAAWLTATAGTG
jgi:threonine/homoserine/homoserine lactone efflux protein